MESKVDVGWALNWTWVRGMGAIHIATKPQFLVLLLAVILDIALSEPPSKVHPTVWFGRAIGFMDGRYRRRGKRSDFLAGTISTLLVSLLALSLSILPEMLPEYAAFAVEVYLLKTTFSIRSLHTHVKDALVDDLDERRRAVSRIVSRDVSKLDEFHVNSAAIESLAENIVDAVIAPTFFYVLFGLHGAMVYRAVNTMDAMIGYREGRYEYFGKFAARIDDLLNYIPARLTLLLFLPFNPRRVLRYFLSAKYKVNSDKPVACMSAVLGVELEKIGVYRFEGRKPEMIDISRALDVYKMVVLEWLSICFLCFLFPVL